MSDEVRVLKITLTKKVYGFGKPETVIYHAAEFANKRVAVDQGDDAITVYTNRDRVLFELNKEGETQIRQVSPEVQAG